MSGDAYSVTATSEEEAIAKFQAYFKFQPCPCGDEDLCICLTEFECTTLAVEA